MKREISAAALLLGFGASGVSAQKLELQGSETMYGNLAGVFQNRAVVDRAARAAHFITLDDAESTPVTCFSCADMGM